MLYAIAFLETHNKLLLVRRHNARFGNQQYSLVGGKVEAGETALQAVIREIKEEVGLELSPKDLTFVHALHRRGTESEFVALCFKADITGKKFFNAEPQKHDAASLFDLSALPDNILEAHKQVIKEALKDGYYSEHGW